jgi:hypothetical protein
MIGLNQRTLACILVMAASACLGTEGDDMQTGDDVIRGCGVSLDSFSDGDWEFQVDRSWDGSTGSVQFPTDLLSDEDYEPVVNGSKVKVVVSQYGERVAIGEGPVEGTRVPSTDDLVRYELDAGTFAGGRFVVWAVDDCLQAELTIYGSGLPIVQSERGGLVPIQ